MRPDTEQEEKLLASHVIAYRLTGDGRKRIGACWDDRFEKQLRVAMRRAAELAHKPGTGQQLTERHGGTVNIV